MSINKDSGTTEEIPLAQNDSLMLKKASPNRLLVGIGLLIGVAFIVVGIITYGLPGVSFSLLLTGALLLLLTLLLLWVRTYSRTSLRKKQQQREIAIQQPEHFALPVQPSTTQELPQPDSVKIRMNLVATFLLNSLMLTIFWFIFSEIITPSWSLRGILVHIFTSVLYGLLTSILNTFFNSRISKQSIEISESGIITSSYGKKKTEVAWQDARLFTTSANPTYPSTNAKKHPVYELVSTQTIVRWVWVHPRIASLLKTEPRMSRDEYDRWMAHLQGYIVARTNLPLLNLDAVELEKGEQKTQSNVSSGTPAGE